MLSNDFNTTIQHIISGNVIKKQGNNLYAIRNIFCTSFATNTTPKKDFENQQRIKKEQGIAIVKFANENELLN